MRRAFALSNRNLTFPPASRRIVPTVMSNASRKRFAFPSMSGIRPIKPQSDVSACKQRIVILRFDISHYLRRLLACCSISSDAVMALELSS